MTANTLNTAKPRIAVIGGGPAGSFFTLYLLKFARETGKQFDITIYQERDFSKLGPAGCKGCAGILSMGLEEDLKELDLTIPESIIQARLECYAVHSPYTTISISNPEKGARILSIYRGGGPRVSNFGHKVSLDEWLLAEAERRGAAIQHNKVSRIAIRPHPMVEIGHEQADYDLVVMASGTNGRQLPVSGHRYIPPGTLTMAQDELYAGAGAVMARLGNMAHVFLIPNSGLVFGTLVPKGDFINVSLLSTGKRPVSVTDFLNDETVRRILPEKYERACGCRPRTLITPARNYYADKFVAIGDAAVTRLYKDGIGSSLTVAREAARAVVFRGASRQPFRRYFQPACTNLSRDNRWGRMLYAINDRAKESRAFLLAQRRLIGSEQLNTSGMQPFTKAAWGMFTGNYDYRSIARMMFNPFSVMRLAFAMMVESMNNLSRQAISVPRELYIGKKKILILGSGFSGTYCLRQLVRSLNRNENAEITMVSNENFFLFSPLLHEAATGSVETRHISYPIRRLHRRDRFSFLQAEVEKIDLQNRRVVTSGGVLEYDHLIIALGGITDTSELNAVENNVFKLKTLRDSVLLRNHIIEVFEVADIQPEAARQNQLLTFIVAGGGYVGVQLITQIRDLIHKSLLKSYREINPANVRIILVESEAKIVGSMHTRMGAYVMRHLQKMGIEVRLKSKVTRAWKDRVEINDSEIIPCGTLIWVTGVVANPRVAELNVEKDSTGRVLINEYLEMPGYPGVYALGDCAYFGDPQTGHPIPPRAHIAVRQAKAVSRNLLAEIRGRDKKPYKYDNSAEVVSLGDTQAVFRYHKLRFYGLPARLVWSVAYSMLVAGSYNRVRILTDWLFAALFGRDTTFLRLRQNDIAPVSEHKERRD